MPFKNISDQDLAFALDNLRTGLAVFDAEEKLVYCNEHVFYIYKSIENLNEIIGLSYSSIIKLLMNNGEFAGGNFDDKNLVWITGCLENHRQAHSVRIEHLADGRHIEIKGRQFKDGRLVIVLTDRTDAIRQFSRLESTMINMGGGFAIWNQVGRLIECNELFMQRYTGVDGPPEIGQTKKEVIGNQAAAGQIVLDVPAEEWIAKLLRSHMTKDSYEVWFTDDTCFTLQENMSRDGGSVTTLIEITSLKHKERQLIAQSESLAHSNSQLLMVNETLEAQGAELVDMAETIHENNLELEVRDEALRDYQATLEKRVKERTVDLTAEMENHKKTGASLLAAKREAEIANWSKSQFLANMSHELRTPLNCIIGYSEMIKGEYFGPIVEDRYRTYASDINDAGNHLFGMIDDILEVSKIELDDVELKEEQVSVTSLLNQCVRKKEDTALKRRVSITIKDAPPQIELKCDEYRVKQIISNLLSNAIKFSDPEGKVMVSSRISFDGEVIIAIEDRGRGIPPEQLERVLNPFSQAADSHTRDYEGAGLGLSICNALVQSHGGRLLIHSEVDEGTCVEVIFPKNRTISE